MQTPLSQCSLGGLSLIYLSDLLCFQKSTDKYCLRCIFYPISMYLFILCIYPSVEIGGTRSSSFFFPSVVTWRAPLSSSALPRPHLGSNPPFLLLSVHLSMTLTTPIHLSGLPEFHQKNLAVMSPHSPGLATLGTTDIQYLTCPTRASRPALTPKTRGFSQATSCKDQITAGILTAAFTDFYHDFKIPKPLFLYFTLSWFASYFPGHPGKCPCLSRLRSSTLTPYLPSPPAPSPLPYQCFCPQPCSVLYSSQCLPPFNLPCNFLVYFDDLVLIFKSPPQCISLLRPRIVVCLFSDVTQTSRTLPGT